MNFYRIDDALRDLLDLYMEPALRAALEPHLDRLGDLAGGRLDELADIADKHPPVLHPRDRFGRDEDWIEYHPAYREMERIGFGEFGPACDGHRAGVLGWPEPLPPIAKYALPVPVRAGGVRPDVPDQRDGHQRFIILRYGSDELKRKLVPRLLSQDMAELFKGTQYMTEKSGGSDVGSAVETEARRRRWRLYGDKWFCSHADGDVVLHSGAPGGRNDGLARARDCS